MADSFRILNRKKCAAVVAALTCQHNGSELTEALRHTLLAAVPSTYRPLFEATLSLHDNRRVSRLSLFGQLYVLKQSRHSDVLLEGIVNTLLRSLQPLGLPDVIPPAIPVMLPGRLQYGMYMPHLGVPWLHSLTRAPHDRLEVVQLCLVAQYLEHMQMFAAFMHNDLHLGNVMVASHDTPLRVRVQHGEEQLPRRVHFIDMENACLQLHGWCTPLLLSHADIIQELAESRSRASDLFLLLADLVVKRNEGFLPNAKLARLMTVAAALVDAALEEARLVMPAEDRLITGIEDLTADTLDGDDFWDKGDVLIIAQYVRHSTTPRRVQLACSAALTAGHRQDIVRGLRL